MKLLLLLLLAVTATQAQTPADSVWTRFERKQKDDYRYGYKDAAGLIRIPAKFGNFGPALKFRHIVAINEYTAQQQYYLLKSGRQVGRDSVYMSPDYEYDCESEGKIRFRDRKRYRMGFFNGAGRVVIPSLYNYVTPFHNGLAAALIGARSKCWSGEADTIQCEHPGWVGGRTVLINERNEVLADSLPSRQLNHLNWYSLRINASAIDTATTRTFRAVNGDQYTFTDYEKEFTQWFYGVFVPALRTGPAEKVPALCYPELAVANRLLRKDARFERVAFVKKFYQATLFPKLSGLRYDAKNVNIFSEDLTMISRSSKSFQSFLTDCGEHFRERYPVFNVVINPIDASGKSSSAHQEDFAFIRTADGYRLFSVSL